MRLLLLALVLAVPTALVPVAATASPRTPAPALTTGGTTAALAAVRVRPRTTFRPRSRFAPRRRTVRPAPSLRRIGRGILQALGIAYLVNLLFGWGPGGSPFGLLLLLGIVALLVSRARRRRHAYTARW